MTDGSSSIDREHDARMIAREQLRARVTEALGGSLRLVPVVVVLAVLGVLFAVLSPYFLTPRNITFLFLQSGTHRVAGSVTHLCAVCCRDRSLACHRLRGHSGRRGDTPGQFPRSDRSGFCWPRW